jgi:peptidoglycan-associated lipoprotein
LFLGIEFLIFDVSNQAMQLKTNTSSLFVASFLTAILLSSCGGATMKKATEAYSKKQYAVAADMFREIAGKSSETKENRQIAAFNAGEGYRLNHDSKNALKMYEKAERYGVKDPIILYRLAQMQKEQGNFEDALVFFQRYQKEMPSDPRSEVMIKGCEAALKWKEEKTRYKIEEFKPANDSKADDFSPMWADRKLKTIVFTSDRENGESKEQYGWTGRGHTDVWELKLEGSRGKVKWTTPEVIEGLNTKYNDGVVTFNKRMSKMYVTQCNGESGKEPNCKIYEARKVGKGWEMAPDPMDFCKNDERWSYGHPVMADDDKTMYFTSNRPGGYGDTSELNVTKDIWMSTYVRRGRTWSEPINLGPNINTEGNEMFPYIHDDGTLYFSSDMHPGMGGLDIFYATKTGEEPTDWSVPQNMKSPINSNGDDFGIILEPTKEHGFFTSNRKREQDDIYEFTMEPILCTLKGQVTDCDSGTAIIDAIVIISNNIDSNKIRLRTDERGYYETPIGINTEYTVEVSKRSDYYYDAKPQYVSTVGVESSIDCQHVKDFCMKNTCNDVFVLPVYYDLDKAFIRDDAKPILDDLINTLNKYPRMAVELGSHTDCRATFEYNRALSQRRADSAIAYIIDKGGINPFRLDARGYGESQLVNHCFCEGSEVTPCSEDEHQKNRRTTVKVVNCNFDVISVGVDYKLRNDAALGGKGSIYSPYLLEKQRAYLVSTKGNIDSFLRVKAIEDSMLIVNKEQEELMAKYDIIPLSKSRDKYYTYGYIGRKKIKFEYNGEERRTLIPQSMVEELLDNKTITPDDFTASNDKIKLNNGMKIFGTSFTLPELKIEDRVYTKVKCKMVETTQPILGFNIFDKEYIDFEIKDDKIWLLKDVD